MVKITGFLLAAGVTILVASCGNVKKFQYLQGPFDTTQVSKVVVPEPLIQKGDLLSINVFSDDAQATAAVTNPSANQFSATQTTTGGVNNSNGITGYLVSQEGNIQLFKLGAIHTEGLTKKQLGDSLAVLYASLGLLKNPFVEVRFINYKVTVIGEVNKPGPFTVPADKVNVFEAIGLAGDITVYGRRDNVLIIREANGVRQFGRIDLSKPDVFLSPYYYLQQNDMIIVDVAKSKASVNNQTTIQGISITATVLSTLAVLISIFRR